MAARQLGVRALGIEWDSSACATRRAAGLLTLEDDVRNHHPLNLDRVPGFIASPPCQTFSAAGKGAGRAALDTVYQLAKTLEARQSVDYSVFSDERTGLVLEPLRWVLAALDNDRPYEWLAFEQVPAVLPVWERMAEVFRREGYNVATGKLSAEEFGVPQTRKRAFLVARLHGDVALPAPTHRPYKRGVGKHEGDQNLLPWLSMADAIGWGMTHRPYPTIASGITGGPDREKVGGSGARKQIYAEKDAGRWIPNAADDARISMEETALLQSFPPGYPWQGSATKIFQQIGNAVPPRLARAVLSAVIS